MWREYAFAWRIVKRSIRLFPIVEVSLLHPLFTSRSLFLSTKNSKDTYLHNVASIHALTERPDTIVVLLLINALVLFSITNSHSVAGFGFPRRRTSHP